ncbi:MAG: hypothetical protein ACJ74Z_01860 [Bryobacteraceae bacterium]
MRIKLKPWLFFAVLALCAGAIVFGIDHYRHRFVRSDADMVALLPSGDATIFFANVAALRQAGVLGLFGGSKTVEEPEYQDFVRQTHFDYRSDIEVIAGAMDAKQVLLIVRGRFDWGRLSQYALAHGGTCKNRLCNLPTTKAGSWASFIPIQSDVMGLALCKNSSGALVLSPRRDRMSQQVPSAPVWVKLARNLLDDPVSLPVPLRIFAISLQSAARVLLSLHSGGESGAAFSLQLDAECPSRATADTIKTQLELQTRLFRIELARERRKPTQDDFAGMLTAGIFHVSDKQVVGIWPIQKELLNRLK